MDVGQGEAILIALPEKTMLIDAGPTVSGPKISQVLHELGREKIDYLVATHPDEDHIGGMADVISSTQIGTIYAPNKTNNTATYRKFLTAIQNNNLQITLAEAGTIIDQTDDYKIEILWPAKDANFPDTNDYSIIIKLTIGNKTFLFTGDAPTSAILQSNPGHIDVLKLSHHGSRTGTNEQLVRKLSPTYAVISYALDNSYGHPMKSVLNALHKHSVEIWGTGANGTITITCDGTTIEISGEKNGTVVAPTSQEKSGTSSKSRTK
ncbi:ComEC/Rec2 family competence protein [Lancefieldella parvula]|uniref:ComEC/Rec2 family competence protein n=1 Tax=Lancefieldella parvula TaxID=1382 RepID=UPI0029066A03|nr:ComEC/Rec2 family competence protein [Lancefieldella parvula]MDU4868098.1 ComEC/Rec2 family competence protein [Lancefieldella parvula]